MATSIMTVEVEGERLSVEVPKGFESTKILDDMVTDYFSQKMTGEDPGALRSAFLSGMNTTRGIYDATVGKLEKKMGTLSEMDEMQGRALSRAAKRASEEHPISSAVGGVLPYMALPFKTVPKSMLSGGFIGGVESDWEPASMAAGAAISGGVTKATGHLMRPITPTREAVTLMNQGVQPTVGQGAAGRTGKVLKAIEDRSTSLPLIGSATSHAQARPRREFVEAAIRRAIPSGERIPMKGRKVTDIMTDLKGVFGAGYDDIYKGRMFAADAADFKRMVSILDDPQYHLTEPMKDGIRQDMLAGLTPGRHGYNYTSESVQDTISFMKAEARTSTHSGNAMDRRVGRVYGKLGKELSKWRNRNLTPALQRKVERLDGHYENYKVLEKAASSLGAEFGEFTPSALHSAVKSIGKAPRTAVGQAPMQDLSAAGKAVLNQTTPSSGTGERLMQGALGGGAIVKPELIPPYLGATGAAWTGQARPVQKWMLGGYGIQTPARKYMPQITGKFSAMLFPDFNNTPGSSPPSQ